VQALPDKTEPQVKGHVGVMTSFLHLCELFGMTLAALFPIVLVIDTRRCRYCMTILWPWSEYERNTGMGGRKGSKICLRCARM
jgi:hypothetical protein